ncbi:MAG: rhodanese-like domain-containing protein [Sulfuricella sp.]|nr:rhodanese-like domain-containing protein [Sulfuricella sp.]
MDRSISPANLKKLLNSTIVVLLDVRRKSDLDASREKLLGATWCDPEQLEEWADKIPKYREVVLYCVRGGSVSNTVVDALQERGVQARFIEGGLEGWKAADGSVTQK